MIVLPSLEQYSKPRPNRPKFEQDHLVPDFEKHPNFWENISRFLFALSAFSPTKDPDLNSVNPVYGYFGNRMHPVTKEPHYYHLGIEIQTKGKQKIYPIMKGVLEYSGYGAINGYYVLLSHPNIQTEDGYVLHTMYCHLKKPEIRFSSYQKMLREISLGSYPIIDVPVDTVLGQAGNSGVSITEGEPSCYIQCDFRKLDHKPIVVDPLWLFSQEKMRNLSENIKNEEELKKILES